MYVDLLNKGTQAQAIQAGFIGSQAMHFVYLFIFVVVFLCVVMGNGVWRQPVAEDALMEVMTIV